MAIVASPKKTDTKPDATELVPLVAAVQQATGRRVHLSTALRWATKGCRGVTLETSMLGGRRLTTTANVKNFMEAITARSASGNQSVLVSPAQADRFAQKAAERLKKKLAAK